MTKTCISQNASASGRVTVDAVDLEGKFIRLSNKADEVSGSIQPGDFKPFNLVLFDCMPLRLPSKKVVKYLLRLITM